MMFFIRKENNLSMEFTFTRTSDYFIQSGECISDYFIQSGECIAYQIENAFLYKENFRNIHQVIPLSLLLHEAIAY